MKKIIALTLCFSMLYGILSITSPISLTNASAAEEPEGTAVSTVDEFLAMDAGGIYYLDSDLDFSGNSYNQNVYTQSFRGVLDGNGHALLGITIAAENSDAGIFANGITGTIKNLTIGSQDAPAKISSTGAAYSVAAMAGTVASGATFDNITIYADVTAEGKTAGFTCYMPNGNLTITNSRVYGSVTGNPAAGFVTMSHDGASDITIKNSANYAAVSGGNLGAGGFYCTHSSSTSNRVCNLVITGCSNHGAVSATDWRVGGIVGEFNETTTSTLIVDYCYNTGAITMNGSGGYAAGIVGGLCFGAPTGERTVSNVYNAGLIRNTVTADKAYALCYASNGNDKVTVTNGAYLDGTATQNVAETGVTKATADTLIDVVKAYEKLDDGTAYVADSAKINEGFPLLVHESTVHENIKTYDCGRIVCLDCDAVLSTAAQEAHTFIETVVDPSGYTNGYIDCECSACHATERKEGKPSTHQVVPTADGIYKIGSADALLWYAANVDAGLLTGKEALVLTADIDLSGKSFTSIGTAATPFRGSFDGAFFTIKNLTVESDTVGGLFGKIATGAAIINVAIDTATVKASEAAGALVGEVAGGAVVKINNIVLSNANITSDKGAAGSLIGSTATAAEVKVNAVISDKATVNGASAGGLVGSADSSVLNNCFVNATVTSTDSKSGYLAYHTGRMKQTNCYYVKNGDATKTEGTEGSAELISSGEAAYWMNAWGANFIFGAKDGTVAFSDNPMRMVRLGSTKIFTNNLLTPKKDVALYVAQGNESVTLTIAIDRNADVKLVDCAIKVTNDGKTEEIKFSDLSLTRYAVAGDTYYTSDPEIALYSITLDGVSTSATYSVGSIFNGAAEVLK